MNVNASLRFLILFTVLCLGAFGCGSSPVASTSATSGGASTVATLSGTITIDSAASPSTQSLKTQSAQPASGYTLLATDVDAGTGTRATTNSQGAYSLSLINDKTYVFIIFDSNNRLSAVVTGTDFVSVQSLRAQGLNPQANEKFVVSAFKTQGDKNGDIESNGQNAWWGKSTLSGSFALIPVDKYVSRANSDGTAVATGGTNGNFGKGGATVTATTSSTNTIDKDLDGIPDYLDPDSNGNGVLDEVEVDLTDMPAVNDKILAAILSSNVLVSYERTNTFLNDTNIATDAMIFELLVAPLSGKETLISKVEIVALPSYKNDILVSPSIATYKETAPIEGTSWSNVNYKLYQAEKSRVLGDSTRSSSTNWLVITKAGVKNVRVGDTFVFKITYADGTSQEITRMLGYTFKDVPKLISYKIGTGSTTLAPTPQAEGLGTDNNGIAMVRNASLTLTWSPPRDEQDTKIDGDNSITINYHTSAGKFVSTEEVRLDDDEDDEDEDGDDDEDEDDEDDDEDFVIPSERTMTITPKSTITVNGETKTVTGFTLFINSFIGASHAAQQVTFTYQ